MQSHQTNTPSICWQSGFSRLGADFLTFLSPTPLPNPQWVLRSTQVGELIGLPSNFLDTEVALQAFAGNEVLSGSHPYASVYSGHQFGVWAGQLGDGRAIHLGETSTGYELQLKGAGRTPYSRGGDGRAVLRSSIREFLCSEAMHALGIPTTRALCLIASDAPVQRETTETAAVVTRVAQSFVRFGHFEHFAARDMLSALRALADYVIERYYPTCQAGWRNDDGAIQGNAYAALLYEVGQRTATMIAQWQAIGFAHGVMNTDNMSILGLTIDYGPFQFLDAFDPALISNHSDHQGRYAFKQQPQIAYWNLFCLGQALLPLIESEDATVRALEAYRPAFSRAFAHFMAQKLGLPLAASNNTSQLSPCIAKLLELLAANRVDYTIFWRRLSLAVQNDDYAPVKDLFLNTQKFDQWFITYQDLAQETGSAIDSQLMLKTNPAVVLRNHLGQLAIEAAQAGNFNVLQDLFQVLKAPFDDHPAHKEWVDFPPDWASSIEISCSS